MNIVVSTRMSEDSLAYLLTTVEKEGYRPNNLSELLRFSAAAFIKRSNPNSLLSPPELAATKQVREWRGKRTSQINRHFTPKAPTPKPSPTITPALSPFPVDPTHLVEQLPEGERPTAASIIAAIHAGIPLIDQLQHSDPAVATITSSLCALLPLESFTAEEQAIIAKEPAA